MEDEEGGFYVNEVDGLPNEHPALPHYDDDDNKNDELNPDTFDDLPTSLIVTNIHSTVFVSDSLKSEMEALFSQFSDDVTFQWLKSFRRLRVNYNDAVSAANARIQLHQFKINDSIINCYFAQPVTPVSNKNLQPPAPTKQFLISPPSSPPAGWMQNEELEPLVNQDLLTALANLNPGEVHELHAAGSESHPSIVVHTAIVQEAPTNATTTLTADEDEQAQAVRMIPTKCPERA